MSDPLTLAADFAPATHEDWLAEVRRVLLRGKPDATDSDFERAFAQRLVDRTEDGLEIQPLYTQAPSIRPARTEAKPWEIRQRVWPAVAGSTAESELAAGATGVLLRMDDGTDLTAALEGVFLDLAPVSLDGASARNWAISCDISSARMATGSGERFRVTPVN